MQRPELTARRRTIDIPSKPETGLAEWTSKIKELQRQVDEDEETEHKRLEEEIAASRRARLRRSGQSSRNNSVDLSNGEHVPIQKHEDPSASDYALPPVDKQKNQEDALRKLMGETRIRAPVTSNSATPMSLAAFMGGRATGPRLTRHAPQQEGSDPTQFEQHTHISSPHPVFGRGGVAMAGMTSRRSNDVAPLGGPERERPLPVAQLTRIHKVSIPAEARDQERKVPTQTTGYASARQRTISTPTGVTPVKNIRPSDAPTKFENTYNVKETPKVSTTPPANNSIAPVSLASFMGGRATGPRLTRQAPQQDAHDPTQFEQRTPTGPHPLFGQGGVAMVGMASGHRTSTPSRVVDDSLNHTPSIPVREWKASTPAAVTPTRKTESIASQRTGSTYGGRQRTISTPTGLPLVNIPLSGSSPQRPSFARPVSHSPVGERQSLTPQSQQTRFNDPKIPPFSRSPIPRPLSAHAYTPSSVPSTPPPKSPITSTFGRPAMSTSRPSFQSPQLPTSSNSSPGFLRPSPQVKDPTPSISRLQGRGFVQSVVKASDLVSSPSTATRTPSPKNSESPGSRKVSVLDRGQFSATGSSTAPPIITPKPMALRKSRTVDPASSPAFPPSSSKSVQPEFTGRTIRSSVSLSSLAQPEVTRSLTTSAIDRDSTLSSRVSGLGSSTTLLSYVKPTKTGDGPASPLPRGAESTEVDELGIRMEGQSVRVAKGSTEAGEGFAASAPPRGQPLTHLTKDRAKKPKKVRYAHNVVIGKHETKTGSFAFDANTGNTIQPTTSVNLESGISESKDISQLEELPSSPKSPYPTPPDSQKLSSGVLPESPTSRVMSETPKQAPLISESPAQNDSNAPSTPVTPLRHSRIPSTGNRATVMDVAQALQQHARLNPDGVSSEDISNAQRGDEESQHLSHEISPLIGHRGPRVGGAEKRRSSYDKYSAIIMPPLKEERTPASSPAGTLTRKPSEGAVDAPSDNDSDKLVEVSLPQVPEHNKSSEAHSISTNVMRIENMDEPLPAIDVNALLKSDPSSFEQNPDIHTISVDVMSISGTTATNIVRDTNIFYDTEVLAIVHRSKNKSSGLASTQVWSWCGKKSRVGEREDRKLHELARRYGTILSPVRQCCEPLELVAVLGGQLVIRQGTRAHWTSDNTAMHRVRSIDEFFYIDELDLHIKNLCSGFSYCVSILETFYVWHGRGSTTSERRVAVSYAQSLTSNVTSVVELVEGENDADDMFWMILGDGGYAKADHWRWRPSSTVKTPRIWIIDAESTDNNFVALSAFSDMPNFNDCVYIADCVWELFVIVGSHARSKRRDIRLALNTAKEISSLTASSRPFTPTVHILMMPSQIPLDLFMNFRDMDQTILNNGNIPDHMHILQANEALDYLQDLSKVPQDHPFYLG